MNIANLLHTCLAIMCISVLFSSAAHAVANTDNNGQWEKPTGNDAPDKEVPGFFVNLGPTGARAVLTEKTFIVRYIFKESPAVGQLKLKDEITGVFGKPFNPHHFSGGYGYEGPIMDLGEAIEKAEGKKEGKLVLNVIRDGKPIEVTITLESIGTFTSTFPFNCKKSEIIRARALKYFVDHPEATDVGPSHAKFAVTLALLSSDDPKHQAMGKSMAVKWAGQSPNAGTWTWDLSFQLIALSEYYLMTKDSSVLPMMKIDVELLEKAQVRGPKVAVWTPKPTEDATIINAAQDLYDGGFCHEPYFGIPFKNGYGPMQYPTILAVIAWQLADMSGIKTNPDYIKRAMGFIHRGTNAAGYVAYGGEFTLNAGLVDPVAWKASSDGSNYVGRVGGAIIAHKLSPELPDSAEYLAKYQKYVCTPAYKSLPDGHADGSLGILTGLLGAGSLEDPVPLRTVMDYHKAYFNMQRCFDGSFVVQPGRDYADFGYYNSSRYLPTANIILALGLNNPKFMVQGLQVNIPGINPKALKGKLDLAYRAIVDKAYSEAARNLKAARSDKKMTETDRVACDAISAYVEAQLEKAIAQLKVLEDQGDFFALDAALVKQKSVFAALDSYKEKIKPFEEVVKKDPGKAEVALGVRYTKLMASFRASKKPASVVIELEKFAEKNPDSLYGKWAGEVAKAYRSDGTIIDPSTAKPAAKVTSNAK